MPDRIKKYLNERGISDAIISENNITWELCHITIPIYDVNDIHLFNKYRRDPAGDIGDTTNPKYRYDKGAKISLYGINKPIADQVIICEGEFDAMILQSKGFCAVTSTGGAMSFQEEWKKYFVDKDVYVCFDNDKAGTEGKIKVLKILPWAKNLPLPGEVGDHGDITDYFIKLHKTENDFKQLMKFAEPVVFESLPIVKKKKYNGTSATLMNAKDVPLDQFLNFKGDFAHCPFHTDKTPSLHRFGNKKDKWKCFSCGEKGDVVDLVRKMNDVSFSEAIKIILK